MEDKTQPIVIKRVKKVQAGHHGGSWKVAFADFMTALFAMFLVLWLVAALDQDQRDGVADYFRDPSAVRVPDPGRGDTGILDLDGGTRTPIDLGEVPAPPTEEQITELAREQQRQRMEALQSDLEDAIEASQAMEPFKDQLLLDITPEGLRIQLVDRENRPMFDLGSAELRNYARAILMDLADALEAVPNQISVTGHTDAVAFVDDDEYDNWELSADRANRARRALLEGGMDGGRVAQVTGLADTVLFDADDPENPMNRRISIVVLNPEAEEALTRRADASPEDLDVD